MAIFLSTPSGWRATTVTPVTVGVFGIFLSTPSGWRATIKRRFCRPWQHDFYPRPPGGGRLRFACAAVFACTDFYPRPPGGGRQTKVVIPPNKRNDFYPRPPGGGRLAVIRHLIGFHWISIHALRVEGDRHALHSASSPLDFYPRPPGGGRLFPLGSAFQGLYFYPRPPGGGRRIGYGFIQNA